MAPYNSWEFNRKPKIKIKEGSGVRGGKNMGSTWWGEQWLKAFNHISDANRIPRGHAYARNGSVQSIEIKKNQITAEVVGTRRYKITIEISPFTKNETTIITSLVAERLDLLSRLLNHELPPELHLHCTDKGVHIFPRRWSDLKASCSCPDWAVPCKHLAAVLYIVAAEIDKNPFLVFNLHGFDLVDALKRQGYVTEETTLAPIAPYQSRWMRDEVRPAEHHPWNHEVAATLDFGLIPDMREQLFSILGQAPVFYPNGDFRKLLNKQWQKTAQYAGQLIKGERPQQKSVLRDESKAATDKEQTKAEMAAALHLTQYERTEKIVLSVDAKGKLRELRATDQEGRAVFSTSNMHELNRWLDELPTGRLDYYSKQLTSLWYVRLFALKCAQNAAIVPQIFELDAEEYGIHWLPALLQPDLRKLSATIGQMLPLEMMVLQKEGEAYFPAKGQAMPLLCAFFLNNFVEQGSLLDPEERKNSISMLFFKGTPVRFERFEEQQYPSALQLWLNRFFLPNKEAVPVLVVEESTQDELSVSLSVELRSKPDMAPVPLVEVLKSKKFADTRLELLRDLSTLGQFFDGINTLMASGGAAALQYSVQGFASILLEKLPIIRLFGIKTVLPKALDKVLRPRPSLRLETTQSDGQSGGISLADLISYQWQIALGDNLISEAEFQSLLRSYKGLFKLRSEYVYFDENEVQKLLTALNKPPKLSGSDLLQIALTGEYEGAPVEMTPEMRQIIEALTNVDLIPVPDNLCATLRPYQHRGYSWLLKNAKLGFGSILADDMGLGKTVQVISALLHWRNEGKISSQRPALAVLPTTLLTNWEKEIARFAPDLNARVFHGAKRDKELLTGCDLVLTSYGILRTEPTLTKMSWSAVVIDESQNIKNPGTEQTKAVKKLKADVRIAMSGTPVENRLSEYWSVFDFANAGLLQKLPHFRKTYALPIERERDQKTLDRFKKVTQPFVMRRLKTDKCIITDLPDKIEQDQFCRLTPDQAALYEKTVEAALKKIESSDGIARQGLVLTMIMALKQICNHPAHFLKKGSKEVALSGKCPMLLELLGQAIQNDEKTLIFTQFTEMGKLLETMIQNEFGFRPNFLHGSVARSKRDNMVDAFQNDRNEKVLLLSLKAGGTGLNLTAASQVIHFDLWWNPAVEAQATDRAFRIGQKKNVQVHRLIVQDTFEERINDMIQKKKELADLTVATGENWIGNLSDGELRAIFS